MSNYNRIHNCKNPYQGTDKKVLCVCSAGLLRSPTAAEILSQEPYNYNTRAVGIDSGHALIPMDDVLVRWADEIVFVEELVKQNADYKFKDDPAYQDVKKITLALPDRYEFRHPELIQYIKEQYDNAA